MGERTGRDRMALLFSIKDRVGVLRDVLAVFASASINLTKIESRPIKNKPWEYMFFLDLKGHKEEPRVKRALKDLERNCLFLNILGSYPSGR